MLIDFVLFGTLGFFS